MYVCTVSIYLCFHIYKYIHQHIYTFIWKHIYIYIYMYIYIYIYIYMKRLRINVSINERLHINLWE